MVRLLRGGEPVKMSKRSGSFVTLAEVVEEVGKDVVRFTMLTRKNDAQMDFDFAKVVEASKDNPVFYVQYAHARICSLHRRAAEAGIELPAEADLSLLDEEELALVRLAAQFPRAVEAAAAAHEPHRIAFWLGELAAAFHALWNRGNDDPERRFLRSKTFSLPGGAGVGFRGGGGRRRGVGGGGRGRGWGGGAPRPGGRVARPAAPRGGAAVAPAPRGRGGGRRGWGGARGGGGWCFCLGGGWWWGGGSGWGGGRATEVSSPPELIRADPGPYKIKPANPGGLDVKGESETAFETSAGEDKDAQLDLNKLPETALAKRPKEEPKTIPSNETKTPVALQPKPEPVPTGAAGSVIQLGAFANQAQAERAWSALSARFASIAAMGKMIVTFPGGIRLRATAASPAEAKQACQALKAAGENCFVAQ